MHYVCIAWTIYIVWTDSVALCCRRILAWLGLAILLTSFAGLAFHTRSMWLPPLSDALYGTRHGFRVDRYGRQVDDMAADQDAGNVHLISIDSQRSDARAESSQAALLGQGGAGMPDRAPVPAFAAANEANPARSSSPSRTGENRDSSITASQEGAENKREGSPGAASQPPGVSSERSATPNKGTAP